MLFVGCGEASSSIALPDEPLGGEATNRPVVEYDRNLLTGLEKGEDYPTGVRPVAIMINNLREALPQSGIASADVIYEMVTEAGITRMMAVYTDYNTVPNVGPVRSARDQFVQLLIPLNAIYVHIGSSIYADNMLNYYNYQDIDGLSLGTTAFYFDNDRFAEPRASEHCWYTNGELIQNGIAKILELSDDFSDKGGYEPVLNFAQPNKNIVPTGGEALKLVFDFSSYVTAQFDYSAGEYYKSEFDTPQMDEVTGTQIGFKNVFLLFTDITLKADGYCTEFDFAYGDGYYFTNGSYQKITWGKGDPLSELKLYDENGDELLVNAGKSYFAFTEYDNMQTVSITGAAPVE